MSYELVAYKTLRQYVDIAIKSELEHHKISLSHSELSAERILDVLKLVPISEKRGLQTLFLLITLHELDTYDFDDLIKAKVLTAACYFVIEEILKEYKTLSSTFSSPTNSHFYAVLTKSLNLSQQDGMKLQQGDLVNIYIQLERFIKMKIFEKGNPNKSYLENNPYAIKSVPKFNILNILGKLLERNKVLQVDQVKTIEEKQKPKSGGFFSFLGRGKKSEAPSQQEHSFK